MYSKEQIFLKIANQKKSGLERCEIINDRISRKIFDLIVFDICNDLKCKKRENFHLALTLHQWSKKLQGTKLRDAIRHTR